MIEWSTISLKDFAGFISEHLRNKGIDATLVGGACVTIYSENRYQSYDLDYVTYEATTKIKKALNELGFVEKDGYFQRKDCPWYVEFVSPPVAVGKEPIQKFNFIKTAFGTIKLLHPVDSVKDRLASYYHWDDRQSLSQAITICLEQEIDLEEVRIWSIAEQQKEKFELFLDLLREKRDIGEEKA